MQIERIHNRTTLYGQRKAEEVTAQIKKTVTSTAVSFEEEAKRQTKDEAEENPVHEDEEKAAEGEETQVQSPAEDGGKPQAGHINVTV